MSHVQDFMTANVVCVAPTDTMDEALDMLVEHAVSVVPVIDEHQRCVGVLSVTRLLELARQFVYEKCNLGYFTTVHHSALIEELRAPAFADRPVQQVMTSPAWTIHPEASLEAAAEMMLEHHAHRLFVVDDRHRLTGVISTMDLIRGFLGERKHLAKGTTDGG